MRDHEMVRFRWMRWDDDPPEGYFARDDYPSPYIDAAQTRPRDPLHSHKGNSAEELEGVPLHAGEQALTLCEVIHHVQYNRIITIRIEDVAPGSRGMADTGALSKGHLGG